MRLRAAASSAGQHEHVGNPFSMLGVPRSASADEVRKAFRAAMLGGAHPDRGGDPEKFRLLRAARDQALLAAARDLADARSRVASRASHGEDQEDTVAAPAEPAPASYQDFLDRKQHLRFHSEARRRAVRDAAREARMKQLRVVRRDPRNNQFQRWRRFERTCRAIEEASVPEVKEAWVRELSMENGAECAPGPAQDAPPEDVEHHGELVGHRTVRSSDGFIKVPIFEEGGARYYVSPLTSRRIAIPR